LRVPATVYGHTLLAIAQALSGQTSAAANTITAMREAHPRFTLAMLRRHEPFRDTVLLDRMVTLLKKAGVPS
jgi:hypothetical protein